MKTINFLSLALILALTWGMQSCSKESNSVKDMNPTENTPSLGWGGDEDVSKIPTTTNWGLGNSNYPSSFSIMDKFPPIGNQESYGTCVSWAAGYNMKTVISGSEKGLSSDQLAQPKYQFSPKDLFWAIPNSEKGANCNGTQFENALNVMQQRGIATMQTVPYTSLGDCSSQPLSEWTNEANNYKVKYWRRVDPSVDAVKEHIVKGTPVLFGAYLSDNFMQWNTDDVISSNTTYDNVGKHAGHALIVAGYDDGRGPNGAFKVVNSWGSTWGDAGSIWVDYNFFFNEFVPDFTGGKPIFIAANQDGDVAPPDENNNPTNKVGVDVAPWVFSDYSTYLSSGDPTQRNIEFNIYNIGSSTAKSTDEWSVYYIYYNAFDANDYGVIFYDQFTNSIPQNSYDCPTNNNCKFNLDIPAGSDFAYEAFGDEYLYRTYNMPEITGAYYLLLLTDGDDVFTEQDEQNNLFYTTLDPLYFEDGWGFKEGANTNFEFKNEQKVKFEDAPFKSVVNERFRNAYTVEEIKNFFKHEIRSERFIEKLQEADTKNGKKTYGKVDVSK